MSRDLTLIEARTLESLIDSCSLRSVLESLSTICGEKSEHILASYDDKELAKAWASAEGTLGVISTHVNISRVSL